MVPGHGYAVGRQQGVAGAITPAFVDAMFAVAVHGVHAVLRAKIKQGGRYIAPAVDHQPFERNIARGQFMLEPLQGTQPEINFDRSVVV